MNSQRGSSLPEALIALLLFAISMCGLMEYHQSVVQGGRQLYAQREAWRQAYQSLQIAGQKVGSESYRLTSGPGHCQWYHSLVISSYGNQTEFKKLVCLD
ncbi:MAG: hypothetical protein XXXJIFNMEKO3_00720 [Candidatus Erwinia impunctatus]|nr:hypothetical protein XXXJIFNMEKO_00720 [Culicoides impunctatus]